MSKLMLGFFLVSIAVFNQAAHAESCPNPQTSSLKQGVIPSPWQLSPFSNPLQTDKTTHFVKATVLEVASYGKGIACTYANSLGDVVIWWPVPTKTPATTDNHWIRIQGGYVCLNSPEDCVFYAAT